MKTLHYFHDPLCGWCYGAAPLVAAASRVPSLQLDMLAGGLWHRPTSLPAAVRVQIRSADARIGQMSGQPFGKDYLEGWLKDETTILDSRPPTAAWLAVQSIAPDRALRMLEAIQKAHYVEGRRVVEPEVLMDLARSLELDVDTFKQALANTDVNTHIQDTQREMARLGVGGFPTAFLEQDGRYQSVPLQSYFGNPSAFAASLA